MAVGPATAQALEGQGVRADAVPEDFRGEGAAEVTLALLRKAGRLPGGRVLLPRAEVAREVLPDLLRRGGAEVDVAPVYRTVVPKNNDTELLRQALLDGMVDAVLFTSGSTVEHLCEALGKEAADLLAPVLIAVIGPITAKTARDHGLHVGVESSSHTVDALLEALEQHYLQARHR